MLSLSHLWENRQGLLTALHMPLLVFPRWQSVLSFAVNKDRSKGIQPFPPLLSASVKSSGMFLRRAWVKAFLSQTQTFLEIFLFVCFRCTCHLLSAMGLCSWCTKLSNSHSYFIPKYFLLQKGIYLNNSEECIICSQLVAEPMCGRIIFLKQLMQDRPVTGFDQTYPQK